MFSFECKTQKKDCLVLFMGQFDELSRAALSSDVQRAYKENLTPELVIFIYPNYLCSHVDGLLDDNDFYIDLTRHKHSSVLCVSFDVYGVFVTHRCINNASSGPVELDMKKLAVDVTYYGHDCLMRDRVKDVLVRAPSGTIFVKPSGKEKEEFIYASQLARHSCEYQFLAMTLLRHAPPIEEVDCIHIDTASIAAVAEALTYYVSRFRSGPCKHIKYESYSSYSGMEDQKPDNPDGAWVIISASANTSMGKNIVKEWNLKPRQVVTMLSYRPILSDNDENIGNAVVFCVDGYSGRDDKSTSPIKVQVQGESFSVEVSTPEQILLGVAHKPQYIDESIYKYCSTDVFSLNKRSFRASIDYRALRRFYENEIGSLSGELLEWIKQVVVWSIPNKLKAIIIGLDDADNQLCEDFKYVLNDCGFDLEQIRTVQSTMHDQLSSIGDGAVLVLSPAISSGHYFVDVNRALRLAGHKGMRVFATPFTVSPSKDQDSKFQKSLRQATNGFSYAFFSFKTVYLGHKNNSTWDKEKKYITEMINEATSSCDDDPVGLKYWLERKSILEQAGNGLSGVIGLAYSGANKKLDFAPDFVFWPPGYPPENIRPEAVYVTTCAIVQNARDNVVSGHKLGSNIYKHSVIAPENFVRFNDSLLQSCIWRSATPSELDYRRSDILSTDFQRILSRIISSSASPKGEVCLDLLMAIAIRWIKLSKGALKKIINDAEECLSEPHAQLLIRFMKKEFNLG